jgi:hypothetical protein
MMSQLDALLHSCGLPSRELDDLPNSTRRFPDGAEYRVEIPSTEGPACLDAVLAAATALEVLSTVSRRGRVSFS